jgi:hypothetical protein
MANAKHSLTAASLALATAFAISCSDGDGGEGGKSGSSIKKDRITGVSQKGPFIQGSSVALHELDSYLSQTGRTFQSIIAEDNGVFEIKGVDLASPYALLKADGYYRNENTGKVSSAPIALYAIADVTDRNSVNINVLTHLEYGRVLKLAEGGMKIADAKKQAHNEILAVFGIGGDFKDSEDMSIFGGGEGDAALLAVSVLLHGDLGEGEFSQRLTNFSQAIKESGEWGNEAAKTAMADWASNTRWISNADLGKIRDNMLAWGLSDEISAFEKHIYNFWVSNYGFEACDDKTKWELKKPLNEKSVKKDSLFVCKYGSWRQASQGDMYCAYNPCLIDERDGQRYAYEKFATYSVMTENLNYSRGNTIGYCYGVDVNGDNPHRDGNGCNDGYGRVYEWEVAMDGTDGQGLCPSGWHLPNPKIDDNDPNKCVLSNAKSPNITAGLYVNNPNYDPNSNDVSLGWRDRNRRGVWWTNLEPKYYTAGTSCSSLGFISDMFSIYCIKDG